MKANKFVKEHGWDFAKLFANGWVTLNSDCDNDVSRNDVEHLVKSYELVQRHETGSYSALENAKQHVLTLAHIEEYEKMYTLEKAVEDVESCL